jgi:hypothetical protein
MVRCLYGVFDILKSEYCWEVEKGNRWAKEDVIYLRRIVILRIGCTVVRLHDTQDTHLILANPRSISRVLSWWQYGTNCIHESAPSGLGLPSHDYLSYGF